MTKLEYINLMQEIFDNHIYFYDAPMGAWSTEISTKRLMYYHQNKFLEPKFAEVEVFRNQIKLNRKIYLVVDKLRQINEF